MKVHRAHLCMLSECGIVRADIARKIKSGIDEIGRFDSPEHLPETDRVEDLYFLYEKTLGERIGHENAAWLHTARSRNDMDGTIFRMVLKDALLELERHLEMVGGVALERCRKGQDELTILYTHGQPANPSTTAHYLSSILLELLEDAKALFSAIDTVDESLMGACAITGTGFPIDRKRVSDLLGFSHPMANTYQAISSSRWLQVSAHALAVIMTDVGRFAADLLHKASCEVGLYDFPDDLVQVSSIMPQKRNPVIIEHLRIQAGEVANQCLGASAIYRNVPFQDVNENADAPVCAFLTAVEASHSVLDLFTETISKMKANEEKARQIAERFGVTTTELADSLVRDFGLGFREAHGIASTFARSGGDLVVLRASFKQITTRELPWTDAEIGKILSPERFISVRSTTGGPSRTGMEKVYERVGELSCEISLRLRELKEREDVADATLCDAWGKI
jgi:argininosuccinate lyase